MRTCVFAIKDAHMTSDKSHSKNCKILPPNKKNPVKEKVL